MSLAELALGGLPPEERAALERALGRSPELSAELGQIQEALGLLPLLLPPGAPPPAVKARLLASLGGLERFAPLLEPIAELIDLALDATRQILQQIEDPGAWTTGIEGFSVIHFQGGPRVAAADVGLVRAAPGFEFPRHRHQGEERILVLEGAYQDTEDGTIARPGDLVFRPTGSVHGYRVEPGQDCLFVTVLFGGLDAP